MQNFPEKLNLYSSSLISRFPLPQSCHGYLRFGIMCARTILTIPLFMMFLFLSPPCYIRLLVSILCLLLFSAWPHHLLAFCFVLFNEEIQYTVLFELRRCRRSAVVCSNSPISSLNNQCDSKPEEMKYQSRNKRKDTGMNSEGNGRNKVQYVNFY